MSDHPIDPFDPVLAALIRSKAAKLARLASDPAVDRHDLVQDLVLALLDRRRRYDPNRATPIAFANVVITHAAWSLLRHLKAKKRTPPPSPIQSGEDSIDERQFEADLARDLAYDVREALAALSPELLQVAEVLSRQKVSEAARELLRSRDTVYSRLETLRKQFESIGLAVYLRKDPTLRGGTE